MSKFLFNLLNINIFIEKFRFFDKKYICFDKKTGNVTSLYSALKKININFKKVEKVSDIDSNKIILPGVGAYGDLMKRVKSKT